LHTNLENTLQRIERLSFHNNSNNNSNSNNRNNNNRNNNNRNNNRNDNNRNNINNNRNDINRNDINRNNSIRGRNNNFYRINSNSNSNSNRNNSNSTLFENLTYSSPNNRDNELLEFVSTFFNSVPIVPTLQEISNSTRIVRYDTINEPLNESCPISLESFRSDEYVTQINFCGHIFKSDQLNNWFHTNVRCPVCRYDIRNTNVNRPVYNRRNRRNLQNVNSQDINQSQDTYNSIINNLSQQLSSSLINSNNTENDRLLVDVSNNILIYETYLQLPNNNNNTNEI
jgi:hypothetical protein